MRLELNFSENTQEVPFSNQDLVNRFIYVTVLGNNNKYHDSFSDYSISGLLGGKMNANKQLDFTNGAKIIISSQNMDFITSIINNLSSIEKAEVGYGIKFKNFFLSDFNVNTFCDKIQTITPILLYYKPFRRYLTFKDGDLFLSVLTENCRRKVEKELGIKSSNITIEFSKLENAKAKLIKVKNVTSVCSQVRLKIFGSMNQRKALYNLGLGKSTGSGFGSVEILSR